MKSNDNRNLVNLKNLKVDKFNSNAQHNSIQNEKMQTIDSPKSKRAFNMHELNIKFNSQNISKNVSTNVSVPHSSNNITNQIYIQNVNNLDGSLKSKKSFNNIKDNSVDYKTLVAEKNEIIKSLLNENTEIKMKVRNIINENKLLKERLLAIEDKLETKNINNIIYNRNYFNTISNDQDIFLNKFMKESEKSGSLTSRANGSLLLEKNLSINYNDKILNNNNNINNSNSNNQLRYSINAKTESNIYIYIY